MTPKTIAVLGCGGRGRMFGDMAHEASPRARAVALAEPRDEHRTAAAAAWGIAPERQFRTWQEFVAKPKMADAVVICTMDRDHVGPAVACLEKGYDLLLEKPMAVTLEDCRAIEAGQRRSGAIVGVCHSLRYHKGFRMARDLIASGAIGRLITLDLIEQVAWWHQAHSFVRGNWGNESRSTFMLLSKSCHDIDYISYVVGRDCRKVSSFGALTFFRRENAPEGATERCLDCPHQRTCEYSAIRHYVDGNRHHWPVASCSLDHSRAAHLEAVRTGPYGRCVWRNDNDVVDHQTVNLLFDGDVTVTFTMTAFTSNGGRLMRANGTRGDLFFDEGSITIRTYADAGTQHFTVGPEPGGHGGGDSRVFADWLDALHSRDDRNVVANAQESLRSHTIVFAAEQSRRSGRTIDMAEFAR
jgi:predicted dehydrogenase